MQFTLLENKLLAQRLAPLAQVTLDDYIAKNTETYELSRKFVLKVPYIFFTDDDQEVFKPDGGWERFDAKYPQSPRRDGDRWWSQAETGSLWLSSPCSEAPPNQTLPPTGAA